MNLATFRQHIAAVDQTTLDSYHDDLLGRLSRARHPATRQGYALALDALVSESALRLFAPEGEQLAMSDDDLLAALHA